MKRLLAATIMALSCMTGTIALSTGAAHAQVNGWTTADSGATVSSGRGPNQVLLSYNGDHAYTYFVDRLWTFSNTASSTTTLQIPYVYTGCHSWFATHVYLASFVTHSGTTTTTPLVNQSQPCPFTFKGTATFNVTAGDTYGFVVGGTNFDSSQLLNGTITLNPVAVTGNTITCTVLVACSGAVATITDADGDPCTNYTATIAWGDGSTSAGTVSGTNATTGCTVTGTHTYAATGSYTTTTTVTDSDGTTGTGVSGTGSAAVTQSTTSSPCVNYRCSQAQVNGMQSGRSLYYKVAQGTTGALTGNLRYTDSANPANTIPGCSTPVAPGLMPACSLNVTSFTCSGTTAMSSGTWTYLGRTHPYQITMSGTSTTMGTATITSTTATGTTFTGTVFGYGIVNIVCVAPLVG